ncbi:helix-turn-helix domain-containing protein [Actinomadura terrae]|uniref:helix-turn-helix domain-containing protein n=1 Tax=Actinomadura terrae TaxID=604353 RepID=UPI0035561878
MACVARHGIPPSSYGARRAPLDARRAACDAPSMPKDDLHIGWGRRLAQVRAELGLSIRALARSSGVHPSHLARFEQGEAGLGDAHRIRVATEVGQRVEDLFPYPDTTPKGAPCPSADSATDVAPSPTRPTAAATRSRARSAVPAVSAPAASRANE